MLNEAAVNQFVETHKKHAARVLDILGKRTPFIEALKSEVGRELLNECAIEMELILDKLIDETADEKDRADFRSYKRIATRWAEKVNEYNKLTNKVLTNKL